MTDVEKMCGLTERLNEILTKCCFRQMFHCDNFFKTVINRVEAIFEEFDQEIIDYEMEDVYDLEGFTAFWVTTVFGIEEYMFEILQEQETGEYCLGYFELIQND